MKNIGAIIFIRSDSRRLPRKTFLPLGSKPLYSWTVDALRQLPLHNIIVATSDENTDDDLVQILRAKNISYFRGPKEDIAQRAIHCCEEFGFEYFIRVNGDSPFVNLPLLREGLAKMKEGIEFVTNLSPRSYPYGISCEILELKKFKEIYDKFSTEEKTHITKYIYKHLAEIKYESCATLAVDYSKTRLTIDTPEDYAKLQYYFSISTLSDFHNLLITNLINDYKKIINDKFIFHKA